MLTRIVAVLVISLIGTGLVLACSDGDESNDQPVDPTEEARGDDSDTTEQEITIAALDSLAYEPAEVMVPAGEHVRIVLDNSESALLHDLTFDDIPADDVTSDGAEHDMMDDHMTDDHMMDGGTGGEVHAAAAAGERASVDFTPLETGRYVFYCTVEGHREAGMEGTLIVE